MFSSRTFDHGWSCDVAMHKAGVRAPAGLDEQGQSVERMDNARRVYAARALPIL